MLLPESKRSAAEPQPNRGTAILAVPVTGGTPAPQCRGTPRGRPEVTCVQNTVCALADDLRLRRLLGGKAAPFRSRPLRINLVRAAWKAMPSTPREREDQG